MALSDYKLPDVANKSQDVSGLLRNPSNSPQLNNTKFEHLVKNVVRPWFNALIDGIDGRDYVVEQGTSGIWTYRKWNSGIAECWGTVSVSVAINTAWGSGYATASSISAVNYPFEFIEIPRLWPSVRADYTVSVHCPSFGTTTATPPFDLTRLAALSSANTFNIDIYVVGTWK